MAISFLFINSFRNNILTKKYKVQIDSAASSGGQGKLTHFMYFRWPPLEAALSISSLGSYLRVP
jgi:hypothetical protein